MFHSGVRLQTCYELAKVPDPGLHNGEVSSVLRKKFLVTEENKRLARWLRLMGYDTVLSVTKPLSALYRRAYNEARILVTRNHRVGASCLVRTIHLTSTERDAQLRQIVREVPLPVEAGQLFSRCDVCNVAVEPIAKAQVKDRVPPYVYSSQETFQVCPTCHRIYWAATHWERANQVFDRLRKESHHA